MGDNQSRSTCESYVLLPAAMQFVTDQNPFGVCSDQGTCEEATGLCQCEGGFTGVSDFVTYKDLDCQVNTLAIRVLWAINMFAFLLLTAMVHGQVKNKRIQHLSIVSQLARRGKKFSLRQNKSLMAILVYLFGCLPCGLAMSVIMVSQTETERVGITPAATVLFALTKTTFYLVAYYYQPALLRTILKSQHRTKSILSLNDTFAFYQMLISSVLGFVPFVTLFLSDGTDEVAFVVYYAYFGGSMLSMAGWVSQAQYIKRKVVKVLDQSFTLTKSKELNEVRDRLTRFQDGIVLQGGVQFFCYAAFFFLPFLSGAHVYFLPISWLAMPLLYVKLARSTTSPRDTLSQNNSENPSRSSLPSPKSFTVSPSFASYSQEMGRMRSNTAEDFTTDDADIVPFDLMDSKVTITNPIHFAEEDAKYAKKFKEKTSTFSREEQLSDGDSDDDEEYV